MCWIYSINRSCQAAPLRPKIEIKSRSNTQPLNVLQTLWNSLGLKPQETARLLSGGRRLINAPLPSPYIYVCKDMYLFVFLAVGDAKNIGKSTNVIIISPFSCTTTISILPPFSIISLWVTKSAFKTKNVTCRPLGCRANGKKSNTGSSAPREDTQRPIGTFTRQSEKVEVK